MMLSTQRVLDRVATTLGADLPAGSVATLGFRVAHLLLELLCMLLLARLLPADALGMYAIALACATVLGVPAAAGFDRLLIREVAALRAAGRWSLLRGILRRASQIALASSTVLALILAGVGAWLIRDPLLRQASWFAAMLLPLVAFARMRQATAQGLGHVPAGLFPETVVQPASMLLLVVLVMGVGGIARTGAGALTLQLCAAAAAMIVGIGTLRRLWPHEARHVNRNYETPRWLASAAPLMWMLGMNMLVASADTIMLGWMQDESIAGRYRVAAQIAMLVSFPMTAINLAAAPVLARHYALGDFAGLRRAAAMASRWSLISALPVAVTLMVAGEWILGLFGTDFVDAYRALAVLIAGYLLNTLSGAAGYLLIMTRHEKLAAWTFTGAAVVNVVANYLLIPRYGAQGAAAATAASVALVGLGMWIFARRHFPGHAGSEVR